MSTNNKVFQVLVAKGNQPLAVAGTSLDALADGQLGIFDVNTNLAVPATAVKKFYIAVGAPDGNVFFSAGQEIQKVNIRNFTYKPHTAARDMVVEITDYNNVLCNTEYGVKFEFRNSQIYARQGYNQFAKTFMVKTDCCDNINNTSNSLELTKKLLEALNNDTSGMFKAVAITGGAILEVTTAPTVAASLTVSIGDVDVEVALTATDTKTQAATKIATAINNNSTLDVTAVSDEAVVTINNADFGTAVEIDEATTLAVVSVLESNIATDFEDIVDGVTAGIRITTNSLAVNKFSDINLKYYKPRTTVIIPSLIEGFNCTGKVNIIETGKPEEGSGYDIKQKEYHAGGWNGKPGVYRASTALGLAMPGFDYMADTSVKYDQFHLVYDQFSTAGWGEYLNNLMTVVAIPATSTVTRNAFATAMNVQLGPLGFETLVDDAAAASTDPDVVETTPPATSALDGIA